MRTMKRVLIALLALVILMAGMGVSVQPAQASGCAYWHTVRYGESLSWIGRYYGVSWPYLAQVNGINTWRYTIYAGQVLCIPSAGWVPGGGYTGGQPEARNWYFSVSGVTPNQYVTVTTFNTPSNIRLTVHMGVLAGNKYSWKDLGDLDTDAGGTQVYNINIPAEYANQVQMKLRLTQTKKNGKVFQQEQAFNNVAGGTGGIPGGIYYPPYYYGTVPTIWIVGVQRDNSVTIKTNSFPAGMTFDVLMAPMGTRGLGGVVVGTITADADGSVEGTFPIPGYLYGSQQIAIRTQNLWSGYYSYNWFFNNSTY